MIARMRYRVPSPNAPSTHPTMWSSRMVFFPATVNGTKKAKMPIALNTKKRQAPFVVVDCDVVMDVLISRCVVRL